MSEYLNTTPIYRNMWESSLSGFNPMALLSSSPYVSAWGNPGGYNWGGGFGWEGFSGSGNSQSSSDDSVAEYKDGKYYKSYKDYEKAKAQLEKAKAEEKLANEQLIAQKEEIKTALTTVDNSIKDLKKSKKKDGSAIVATSRKDMTWGQRALRTVTNMGKGIWNTIKGVAGFESDGKWNWKKCLKNAAITAAAIGACFIPVVGPAIGVALAATGVAAGTVGIVKSSVEMSKAKTDAEKDKAQQNLGANIFVTISSALGLKGAGKAFRTSNAASNAASGANAGTASTTAAAGNGAVTGGSAAAGSGAAASGSAAARSGAAAGSSAAAGSGAASGSAAAGSSAAGAGSKLASVGQAISNFFKDMTVNAWKGMKQNIANDKAAVAADGFWKTFGSKFSNAFKSNYYTKKYDRKKDELLRSLDERIQKIDADLPTKTGNEKVLLEFEKDALTSVINKVRNAKTKADWDALSTNKDISDLGSIMQGEQAGATESMLSTIKRISKENENLLSQLEKLSKFKLKSMREKTFSSKKYKAELDDYVSSETLESHWWKPKFGNDYQKILGKNSANRAILRGVGNATIAPAGTPAKVMNTLVWPMSTEYGIYMDADTVAAQLEALEAQKAELEAALKEAEKALK